MASSTWRILNGLTGQPTCELEAADTTAIELKKLIEREINVHHERLEILQGGVVMKDAQMICWHPSAGELQMLIRPESGDVQQGRWLEIRGWDERYIGQHIRVLVTHVDDDLVKVRLPNGDLHGFEPDLFANLRS